jgi:hypothetical protein
MNKSIVSKIENTVENWENGTLGNDERYVKVSDLELPYARIICTKFDHTTIVEAVDIFDKEVMKIVGLSKLNGVYHTYYFVSKGSGESVISFTSTVTDVRKRTVKLIEKNKPVKVLYGQSAITLAATMAHMYRVHVIEKETWFKRIVRKIKNCMK